MTIRIIVGMDPFRTCLALKIPFDQLYKRYTKLRSGSFGTVWVIHHRLTKKIQIRQQTKICTTSSTGYDSLIIICIMIPYILPNAFVDLYRSFMIFHRVFSMLVIIEDKCLVLIYQPVFMTLAIRRVSVNVMKLAIQLFKT